VYRLAARDLRRHAAQSTLLLLVITATAAMLTLGLAMHTVTTGPWNRTFAATNGPDVVAQSFPPPPGHDGSAPQSATQKTKILNAMTALPHTPGVAGSSGPFPTAYSGLSVHGTTAPVMAEGRDTTRSGPDTPELTAGTWVRPGGVVLQRSLADALGVGPGARVTLGGRPFLVDGVAVTAAQGELWVPGLVWVTRPAAVSLATRASPLSYVLNLRLADPASAPAFANAHSRAIGAGALGLTPWQQVRSSDTRVATVVQIVLLMGSWLLGLLALASVAVLVGGRMADQTRRVGLLKAVGGTPGLAAVVLLAEHLVLALGAAALGLAVGWLAAPLLTGPGNALLGTASSPSLTVSTVLLLGLRLAARRPRRAILTAATLVISVATVTAALITRYSFEAQNQRQGVGSLPGLLNRPLQSQVNQVVLVLGVIMVVLAAINAIFITQATVLDAQRPSALARALGATPRQVSAGRGCPRPRCWPRSSQERGRVLSGS
jgi:putative ABC transport system permease protein